MFAVADIVVIDVKFAAAQHSSARALRSSKYLSAVSQIFKLVLTKRNFGKCRFAANPKVFPFFSAYMCLSITFSAAFMAGKMVPISWTKFCFAFDSQSVVNGDNSFLVCGYEIMWWMHY